MKKMQLLLKCGLLSLALAVVFAPTHEAFAAAQDTQTKKTSSRTKSKTTKKVVKKARAKAPAKRLKLRQVRKIEGRPAKVTLPSPSVDVNGLPVLQSSAVVVQDQQSGNVLYEKNAHAVMPIASITKLMTAMVTLDAKLDLREMLEISDQDVDHLKGTSSRVSVGTVLSREDMLRLALMASENRAAATLSRHYPGGRAAFIQAMNAKAQSLGLQDTHYYDSTGLNKDNVSSARDLMRLVAAASTYPLIREFSTMTEYSVETSRSLQKFRNTNALVKSDDWQIGLSKTGFINESGKCLVMQAWVNDRPVIIVLLDSWGKFTRLGDANRIKQWLTAGALSKATAAGMATAS